jgi:hypothetical protein
MRAQVTLIPTESKKPIAKAVAKMDEVRNAFEKGIVTIHPHMKPSMVPFKRGVMARDSSRTEGQMKNDLTGGQSGLTRAGVFCYPPHSFPLP